MAKFLLKSFLPLVFLIACSPSSRNAATHSNNSSPVVSNSSTNTTQPPIEALVPVDTTVAGHKDSSLNTKPLSLMDLPQTEDGEIVLSDGFYEADFKSYCLQPGTPSPSDRDAYRQGTLTTYRRDIVETILRNSLKKPELEQRNIQLLLWSVVSGSDFRKLSWEVQGTAQQLLTRKQIFELQGGVMGIVKTVSMALPESGATSQMKQLFEMGTSSYEAYERIAVLQQKSHITQPEIKKDQWYKQPGGYWLRYFPSSYQHVKIQVYVPQGTIEKNSTGYLLFDPVTMMAIPANSNAQRLGIGAPAIDVLRKIIQIQRIPPPPPTKKPPVKSQNPKEVIMK
jgi:hypothetical protein